MTLPQILLLLILIAATTLYITRWISTEATSLITVAALALTGVLAPGQAISGFSSTAVLTVGAMFVLSEGLLRTGALEAATVGLANWSRGSPRRLLLMMGLTLPIASAFMNNTPIVVMMVPIAISLGNQFDVRPSRLLIPISYFSILGGTITLIGTSTNILVDELYRQSGGPGFNLFTFAPLGIIYCVIGVAFILLVSERLLPNRAPLVNLVSGRSKATYISEVIVTAESQIIGRSTEKIFERIAKVERRDVPTSRIRHRRLGNAQRLNAASHTPDDESIELLEIFRDGHIYRAEETRLLRLRTDDVLMVAGTPNEITRFLNASGSQLATVLQDNQRTPSQSVDQNVVEAVVLPDSPYNGRLIRELQLNRLYGIKLLGRQRNGRQQLSGLRESRLQSGDVLLLQGTASTLRAASETGKLLLVEGVEGSILRTAKSWIALAIMLAVVLLVTLPIPVLSEIPIMVWAIAGAALMIVTNCLRADEAVSALDSATLLLLVAAIPLGLAMETTGLAQAAVNQMVRLGASAPPVVFLSAFYLLTNLLTQIISNNAAAVLLTPIALSLAASLGFNATPFLIAIAFGASASFMTPMGYQTNAIVMGPGGYTFTDYLRIGVPLSIIMWLTATFFIPLLWPLT